MFLVDPRRQPRLLQGLPAIQKVLDKFVTQHPFHDFYGDPDGSITIITKSTLDPILVILILILFTTDKDSIRDAFDPIFKELGLDSKILLPEHMV